MQSGIYKKWNKSQRPNRMKSQRPYPSLLTLIASTMSALPTPVRAIVGSEHLHLQSSAHSSTQKGLDLIKLDLVGKESLFPFSVQEKK